MALLTLLIFISLAAGGAGVYLLLTPSRTGRRLKTLSEPLARPAWEATLAQVCTPFAQLSTPSGNWDQSALRLRFIAAGFRRDDARLIYFGAKTLLPLLFAGAAWLLLRSVFHPEGSSLLLWVTGAALAGCYLPNLVLGLCLRRRTRQIFDSFPDAADLMLVCVEAGLGLDAALGKITDEIRFSSAALAEELQLTRLEMRAGGTREKSLHNLALRTGLEEVGIFATMLTQSDKFGTSLGDSLRVFSEDLRTKRQLRAEELAAKVPTKMLIPLVLFIFPSILMVIIGPTAIVIIRTMLPALGGQ
ncbi:MAG: type II secretion system F family protein [Massilia sp.]